jgi:hypothetical protein
MKVLINEKKKYAKLKHYIKFNELLYLIYKAFFFELRFINIIRFYYISYQINLKISKLNFFCIRTQQKKGLIYFFNIFRMNFKQNALFGTYSGIKRKSW